MRSLGNRLGQLGWGLLGVGLAAASCGKGDNNPAHGSPGLQGFGNQQGFGAFAGSGGKAGKAGTGSGGNAGEGGGEGGMPGSGDTTSTGGSNPGTGGTGLTNGAGAPVVHVTSPVAVSDPNDKAVLVANNVDVLCTATKATTSGSKSVDESTILLEMLDASGTVMETHPGTPTSNDNEYTASFNTLKVPDNGVISFVCQASDTSNPPRVGLDQIDTFIDHGPTITAVDPPVSDMGTPPYATAVKMPLQVAFTVAAAPVAKGDKGSAIGTVSLTVGGKPFDLTLTNGQYTATVNLDDPTIFSPIPDGDQKIVIDATDRRQTKAAVAEFAYDFVVDSTGPTITIVQPQSGDIEAGKVEVIFTVTDAQSGVDPSGTTVIINKKPYPYDPDLPQWSYDDSTGTFKFNFDTTQIENSVAQATLSVTASDRVGNKSSTDPTGTNDALLWLDNVPPTVDLDPQPVREFNTSGNCSIAFDPVGPQAANDLQVVHTFRTFRALVWDETNEGTDEPVLHAAGVDTNSVYLYLQPNPAQGLLVDTTGDGICDDLLKTDQVTGANLPTIQLLAVPSQGASWFGGAANEDTTLLAEFPMPNGCTYQNAGEPLALCTANNSDMLRVIHWSVDSTVPAVFAIPQLAGLTCTGDAWEIGAFVNSDGWICAAATAKDNVKNVGISAPLRLCYETDPNAPPPCADPQSSPPPSCVVDNCALPPRFLPHKLKP